MLLTETHGARGLYRVEVSGWDLDEIFFVEKADIAWDEETGKRVKLRRPLRKGSVVFVRLLQTSAAERGYPMPYEVDPLQAEQNGYCEYRLRQVQGRSKPTSKTIH
ncbi:MAG: hypothetical protein LAN84_10375 [Acidobacteriia bacterium]|nr:hypothetical protein [Terriglobia bacterium]